MLVDGPGIDDPKWRRRAESTIGPRRRARSAMALSGTAGPVRGIGRMFDPELTMLWDAATLLSDIAAPTKESEPEMRAA